MSLQTRVALFVAVAVAAAVGLVALFAYSFASDEATAEVDDFLRRRGVAVGLLGPVDLDEFGRPFGGGPGSGPGRGQFDSVVREDVVAQLVESSGDTVAIGDPGIVLPVENADLELTFAPGEDLLRDVVVDGIHLRMLTRHIRPGLAIQVARDMSGTDQILSGLRLRLLLLGLAGVAAAAAVGWVVSRRTLRPIVTLTEAASHVAVTRDLDARIEFGGRDELGQLAESFNSMLAALEDARSSQHRLVSNASHELRSPLTSLRTNIELLQRDAVHGDERESLLDDVGSELVELSNLVTELVDLATVGRDAEPPMEIDLAEVVDQAVRRHRRRHRSRVRVVSEPTLIDGRPAALLRAVSNLLDNAAKWGGDEDIEITLSDGALRVRDRGPGIPEADLPHVFDRFYRSQAARSMPGSGLGLSIVAAVANDHGGGVFATNHVECGAVVGFSVATSGR